jgi:hypothetical protein
MQLLNRAGGIMRSIVSIAVLAAIVCLAVLPVSAQETEQDILNRYINKAEKKQTVKYGWASVNVSMDRINRNNNYNAFATYESQNIDGGNLDWLNMGTSFGAEFALLFQQRVAWTFGGEYWLKQGQTLSGDFTYLPTASTISDPSSDIQVYGLSTGVQYFLMNPPSNKGTLTKPALRVVGTAGYYFTSWELWTEYQNLNLSTAEPEGSNSTYKGSAPGFSLGMGADYPLRVWNLAIGADMSYLYLNFNNVGWYNSSDEEVVASYDGSQDGRVDLTMSGFRGKIEIKRYISW